MFGWPKTCNKLFFCHTKQNNMKLYYPLRSAYDFIIRTSQPQFLKLFTFALLFVGATLTTLAGNEPALPATGSTFLMYPNVLCSASFTDSTSDLRAYFTGTSTGVDVNTTYRWNFGDGTAASHLVNPTHIYATGGQYTVCLVITNSVSHCFDSVCHTVTITQCQASFDTTVIGDKLTVKSTSTGIEPGTGYHWDFGDGGIGNLDSQSHTYPPTGTTCSVLISLTNNQNVATAAGFTQMVVVNSSTFSANEMAGLQNVEFTTGNFGTGTVLQAWIESGDSSSSAHTVYWVNLGTNIIPANGSLNIYLNFMSASVLSSSGPTGEAPQLSTTYGQYDNGNLVFTNFYDNFNGNSLSSSWTNTGATSVTVSNGLTLGYNGPNWYGIYTNTFSSALGTVAESYCASASPNTGGLCINTSGTDGNGINDGSSGVDAQLSGPSGSNYMFGSGGSCTSPPNGNATLANASPVANTYYLMSFYMLNTPVLELNYGAFTTLTGTNGAVNAISANSEVGLGVSGATGSFQWFRDRQCEPNGVMPVALVGNVVCQPAGSYNVCLTITNSVTGCNNTSCQNVVIEPFVSSCTASFKDSVSDDRVYLTSTSTDTDANTHYSWNFGNGTPASHLKNVSYRYATGGTYTVCLEIFNSATGCSDSVCHSVTTSQCQASFDTSTNINVLTVTSTSTGVDANTHYHYDFGDGTTGNQADMSHTYNNPATVCSLPVVLNNNQNTATGAGFTQMITVNSSTYSSNETADLDNVEFSTGPQGTGTLLQAWIESGNSSSSTATVYWVNLGSNIIPANGSLTIYMNLMPFSVLSANGPTGEAPQLSGSYAQYDNGSLVFPNFYDNFSGSSLSSDWTSTGAASVTVNDGLALGYNGPNWYGIYTNTFSSALGTVAESYCAASSTNGGLCINTSGTNGNGVNNGSDGVDAQLSGPANSGYMFGSGGSCTSPPNANATVANASPVANTYYLMSFYMLNTPVLKLNYGAFTTLTGTNGAVNAISANSEVGLGVSGATGSFQWFRDRQCEPNGVMPAVSFNSINCSKQRVFNVCLTITNSVTGCSSETCETVTVGEAPNPCAASYTDSTSDLRGYFTSTSTGVDDNTVYHWNFGDGTSASHVTNPTHLYASGGTYTVCLAITNDVTHCFDSVCHTVTITQCQAAFDTVVTLNRLVVHSTSTGVDANTQYHWSFGDDSIGTIDSQAHTYALPGTYNVCLTISNAVTGCTSTTCEDVVITPFVSTCNAAFSDSIDDLKGYFTNRSTGTTDNTNYSWNFGDGTAASHVQDPIHLYADTGTYLVCLVISNIQQQCFDSICKLISIKQCHASFKDTGVSVTGLLTVVSTSTGVDAHTKYHWTFGDDSIGTLDSQAHTYHTPGKYLVCLTITNSVTGCQSTACDTIVYTLPNSECTADFAWQDEYGYGIQFRNESKDTTPNTQLTWNMGDGTVLKGQHEPEHRYAHSGTYIVCLNIVDSTETYCNSTFCDTINFVHTGIDQLSFVGSSLYYDANNSQVVLNWVGNDKATINLVDILGREEQQVYAGNLNTGTYRFNVNSSFIATGIYFVRIVANDGSRAWKIFILPH